MKIYGTWVVEASKLPAMDWERFNGPLKMEDIPACYFPVIVNGKVFWRSISSRVFHLRLDWEGDEESARSEWNLAASRILAI